MACGHAVQTTVNRPRPSFLCPDIEPLIDVPTHPSYPSGHSTQAYLVALALSDVLSYRTSALEWDKFDLGLRNLAKQIGENREWAGVHYQSDTIAGRNLAQNLWNRISNNPKEFKATHGLIEDARQEWYENIHLENADNSQTGKDA